MGVDRRLEGLSVSAWLVVWHCCDGFRGQATITTPTATDDKPVIASSLRFPGQVEDAETGLYYNWHRYYDPELGRYVTGDPVGLAGGANLYLYAYANPISYTDISGEISIKKPHPIVIIIEEAIRKTKECLKDKKCRCQTIYAAYYIPCKDWARSCKKTPCGPLLDANEKAARYCYQLRDLYVRMNCDAVIPTKRNHPGER